MLTLSDIPPTIILSDLVTPPDSPSVAQVSILRDQASNYLWFVAETKTRQEKALARYLSEHDVCYFLPYTISKTPSNNRVFAPLLAGFVFVAIPGYQSTPGNNDILNRIQRAYETCRESRAVWGFITAQDQSRFRKDLIALASPFTMIEPANVEGARVRVIGGDFEGLEGTIVFVMQDETRVLFDMQVVGQPYSTVIPTNLLKPVNGISI